MSERSEKREQMLAERMGTSPFTGEVRLVDAFLGPTLLRMIDDAPKPTTRLVPEDPESPQVLQERAHFDIASGTFVKPTAVLGDLITVYYNDQQQRYDLVPPTEVTPLPRGRSQREPSIPATASAPAIAGRKRLVNSL